MKTPLISTPYGRELLDALSDLRKKAADSEATQYIVGYLSGLIDATEIVIDAEVELGEPVPVSAMQEAVATDVEKAPEPCAKTGRRIYAEDVLHYLMDHDGVQEMRYIVRDLYGGKKTAWSNLHTCLMRLKALGDVSLDKTSDGHIRVTARRYPRKED